MQAGRKQRRQLRLSLGTQSRMHLELLPQHTMVLRQHAAQAGQRAGFQVAPRGIHILSKSDRAGTTQSMGIANVRFVSPAEAERARLVKHRSTMGSRYIECLSHQPDVR